MLVLAGQDGNETRSIGDLPVSAARDSGDDEAHSNEEHDLEAAHGSRPEESDVERVVASEGGEEEQFESDLEEAELWFERPVPVWSRAITVPGQKVGSKLFLDTRTSYVYRRKSEDHKYNRMYCTCQHKYCRGTATLIPGEDETGDTICQTKHHDHDPSKDYRDGMEFRRILYHRAQTESTGLKVIYDQEASK